MEVWGEKFGRPTKMATHLEGLLEINFLYPSSKYGYGSPFSSPTGVALKDGLPIIVIINMVSQNHHSNRCQFDFSTILRLLNVSNIFLDFPGL